MAKPATMERKKKLNTGNASDAEKPPAVYGVRMSRPYLAWLNELSETERCGKADVIDRALATYADKLGFKPPPKR
jgi:hypothetical protein